MKIASFNVNGITARLPNLLRWLAETRPDIACLQELKVPHDKFPEAAVREAGYGVIWHVLINGLLNSAHNSATFPPILDKAAKNTAISRQMTH